MLKIHRKAWRMICKQNHVFETKNWTNTQYSILNDHILLRWNTCAHFTVNCTYIGAVYCIYTADKHVILSVFFSCRVDSN